MNHLVIWCGDNLYPDVYMRTFSRLIRVSVVLPRIKRFIRIQVVYLHVMFEAIF